MKENQSRQKTLALLKVPVNWKEKLTRKRVFSGLALILCPVITFYLFDMYTHNPFTSMNFKTQVLNMIFYMLTSVMLFGLVGYLRLALMLQSGIFMLIGLVNYYVLNFRSAPIMPWDIFSLSTAASVAGNFSYVMEAEAVFVLISFVLLLVIESRCKAAAPKRKHIRLLMVVLPLVLLWSYTGIIQNDAFVRHFGLYDKLFTPTVMNKRDGNVVAFLMEMEYLKVEKPAGYSADKMGDLFSQGDILEAMAAVGDAEGSSNPNIIVIMDEAFSDLSVLGDFETNMDYMPFIHSLQNGAPNTVTGNLNVSILGGNTANTEFEFLTGNTMAFLPQGSVAYQQYVKDEFPALPSYLKSLGYDTVAIHPYYADGWDRDTVYPMLGFDQFLSRDDFRGAEKLRSYVSDSACFDSIIQLYEEKEEKTPLFVFNVTMQNHSGYEEEYDNFISDVTVEGSSSKALSQYLSLLRHTDKALESLIDYFREVQEETIILFFGDHQPTTYVSNPILRLNEINPDTLTDEENLLKYKVPFVMWSNFDIKSEMNLETSPNYLAIDLLEKSGLQLPPYQELLKEVREEYPVITGMTVKDRNGSSVELEDVGEQLLPYQSMQYYLLFDYDINNRKNIH